MPFYQISHVRFITNYAAFIIGWLHKQSFNPTSPKNCDVKHVITVVLLIERSTFSSSGPTVNLLFFFYYPVKHKKCKVFSSPELIIKVQVCFFCMVACCSSSVFKLFTFSFYSHWAKLNLVDLLLVNCWSCWPHVIIALLTLAQHWSKTIVQHLKYFLGPTVVFEQ